MLEIELELLELCELSYEYMAVRLHMIEVMNDFLMKQPRKQEC
jgi:hypothetical protein